jgi:hypothetical protein
MPRNKEPKNPKSNIVDERGSISIDGGTGDQPTREWNRTYGQYIAGRSHLDGVDALAAEMEAKWGVDRLRLLVPAELREKFDRQRYLLNQAIWHGKSTDDVRIQAERMEKAWRALDKKASELSQEPLRPDLWEVALPDGSVAVLARSVPEAGHVLASGRAVSVFTLDEIAKLIHANRQVMVAKQAFPGATVTAARNRGDPLDAFPDSTRGLNEPLVEDEIPW